MQQLWSLQREDDHSFVPDVVSTECLVKVCVLVLRSDGNGGDCVSVLVVDPESFSLGVGVVKLSPWRGVSRVRGETGGGAGVPLYLSRLSPV